MAAQVNTTCLCGMPGCSISPVNKLATERPGEDAGLNMGDVTKLQVRAMIIGQICKLNQQLDPQLHITVVEARRQPLDYPQIRTELLTSLGQIHKEQLTGKAAQTSSESPIEAWTAAIHGVPSGKLCPWCGDTFQWGGSRRRHMRRVHKGDRNCPHCEIPYCSQRMLQRHLVIRRRRGSCYLKTEGLNRRSEAPFSETKGGDKKEVSDSD